MAKDIDTLIVPELGALKGRWGDARRSPPVSASDIRKWAIATYWPATPPAVFWDESEGAKSRWQGLIAPPDFNPFAWPVHRAAPISLPLPKGVRLTGINGGQVENYGVPQRPGDVITERMRVKDYHEREGKFGLMLYVALEAEWTNQSGEFVRRRVLTSILY